MAYFEVTKKTRGNMNIADTKGGSGALQFSARIELKSNCAIFELSSKGGDQNANPKLA